MLMMLIISVGLAMVQNKNDKQKADLIINDELVDTYGQGLCLWANSHHKKILINDQEILYYVPPAGGWGVLYWDYPYGNSKQVLRNNRDRLKKFLVESICDKGLLDKFLGSLRTSNKNFINSLTDKELSDKLSCLGKMGFQDIEFSSD